MKVINRNLTAVIMVLMVFALIPTCDFAYADEVLNNNGEDCEEYIEATEEEYVICDDSSIEDSGDINVQTISNVKVAFNRLSSTSSKANVSAHSTVKSITSKIYLQKYVSSKEAYANVKGVSSTKTVSAYSINHAPKFAISANGKYRIKVVLSDGTVTHTKYKNLS